MLLIISQIFTSRYIVFEGSGSAELIVPSLVKYTCIPHLADFECLIYVFAHDSLSVHVCINSYMSLLNCNILLNSYSEDRHTYVVQRALYSAYDAVSNLMKLVLSVSEVLYVFLI